LLPEAKTSAGKKRIAAVRRTESDISSGIESRLCNLRLPRLKSRRTIQNLPLLAYAGARLCFLLLYGFASGES